MIIRKAQPADMEAVRQLCWDYRDFLLVHNEAVADIIAAIYPQDKYAELMDRLEDEHAAPAGIIYVAEVKGKVIGCGMAYTMAPRIAEIKRVFVDQEVRGTGAGKALCLALIDWAKSSGFHTLRLDTSRHLPTAKALYLNLGFKQRDAYHVVPEIARDTVIYFEMDLRDG